MTNYIHTDENAVYHECGYSNDHCICLLLGSETYLLTDSRYTLEASQELSSKTKLIIGINLAKEATKLISKAKIKQMVFDPKEWDYYSITQIQERTKCKWIAKIDLSHKKRIIKTKKEISILEKAVRLGAGSFDRFAQMIASEGIGKSEKELFFLAGEAMSRRGKNPLSFEPIVAIGANAAKPHALPTDRVLAEGDLLLFDAGLKHKRYCSDRTRTVEVGDGFGFGREQKFGKKKIQKAYDAVLKAHDKAITKARSGMRAKEIDALCRDVIEKAGFGKQFIHSTGHGVGLDIHEMPYISRLSKTKIQDGMVYTIEPGIYISESFGIRIEDMVVMDGGRARVL